jgi:two-component system, NtrC family, response regulator GlrR
MSAAAGEIVSIRKQLDRSGIRLIGESVSFIRLLQQLRKVACSDATVLLEGETGTGKELAARAIHCLSDRHTSPFVAVNCGAIPDTLIENELFGHRRGAYTNAAEASPGLVRLAAGGTLFLDEINALSMRAQVVLLRFLQDRRFRSLGANSEETANIRVIAAANRRLKQEMEAGRLREDLFYRLNLLSTRLPPLRERTRDPSLLARHFVRECSRHYRCPEKQLEQETVSWIDGYGWPGNIRELEHLIHREFLMCDDDCLHIDAPSGMAAPQVTHVTGTFDKVVGYGKAKALALEQFNRTYLSHLMEEAGGNVTRAAQLAGKERRAFGKLLKRYHILPTHRVDFDPS